MCPRVNVTPSQMSRQLLAGLLLLACSFTVPSARVYLPELLLSNKSMVRYLKKSCPVQNKKQKIGKPLHSQRRYTAEMILSLATTYRRLPDTTLAVANYVVASLELANF